MLGLQELATIGALTVLIQFVAAILGPRALHLVSVLIILAAAGVAAYLGSLALNAEFAGEGAEAYEAATSFGLIAVFAILSHFAMRGFFKRMARASQA